MELSKAPSGKRTIGGCSASSGTPKSWCATRLTGTAGCSRRSPRASDARPRKLARQPPTRLVLHLTHEPLRGVHFREQERVGERVERNTQEAESGRDRRVHLCHAVLLRHAMLRGELESP